jgi:hypothetical protein
MFGVRNSEVYLEQFLHWPEPIGLEITSTRIANVGTINGKVFIADITATVS